MLIDAIKNASILSIPNLKADIFLNLSLFISKNENHPISTKVYIHVTGLA